MTILRNLSKAPLHTALAAALVLAAAPATLAISASPSRAQSGGQLDQAVAALRGITTMKADFTQTDRAGNSARGTLTLKNPGRIRFEYQGGDMLIVSDGRSLAFADYEVNQLERWPIRNSPLGALLDPNRDVKRYGKIVPTANAGVISVQVKDAGKPEYGTFTMIFVRKAGAPGGLELASWVALDAQNNRTTVRLSNHRYGMTVADSTFTYRDPRRTSRR